MNIYDLLKKHEGIKLFPYTDTVGKLTIGVGRNLTDVGISEEEAERLLDDDVNATIISCKRYLPWFVNLDTVRQDVITDMVFNMGIKTFSEFVGTIAAIKNRDWLLAASHMRDSKWAEQVGERATELAAMMETGCYQTT